MDPDEGPQSLGFLWEFGDGTSSTAENPTHTYAQPRAYRVKLTASDGADAREDSLLVHVLAPPTPRPAAKSSPLALNPAGTELWVANPDSDSVAVLAVAANSLVKLAEFATGKNPRTLAFSPDGARAFVACQDANELWVTDAATRLVVRKVAVGHRTYGVAVAPGDGRIVVSSESDGTVAVISPELVVEKMIAVAATPRAIVARRAARAGYEPRPHIIGRRFSKHAFRADDRSCWTRRMVWRAEGKHLRRGPRIVATDEVIAISAISHEDGDVHAWTSSDGGATWKESAHINDIPESAREGLHAMAADGKGSVFATCVQRAGVCAAATSLCRHFHRRHLSDRLARRAILLRVMICEMAKPQRQGPISERPGGWRENEKANVRRAGTIHSRIIRIPRAGRPGGASLPSSQGDE